MRPVHVEEAYRRYFPVIRERCRRILNDAAEAQDVAQETFVRLWRSGPRLEHSEDTLRWIYRASGNLALDALRRKKVRGAVPAAAPLPTRHDEAYEHRDLLRAVAGEVRADEWQAAVLTRLDGLSQMEAAQVLGCTDRTLRRLLERFDARARPLTNPEAS